MKKFISLLFKSFVIFTISIYVFIFGITTLLCAMGCTYDGTNVISVSKIALDLLIYVKLVLPAIFMFSYIKVSCVYLREKEESYGK